ncbi:MAG: transposase family protein, partial [Bacteriovoracaceae bacterium]|nr:transposase family protein [Bacteriovoracaceae bacterium]
PRMKKKCAHNLIDILVIVVCASLCRFDESWKSIEDFGELRRKWLENF